MNDLDIEALLKVVIDPSIPPDEIHFIDGYKLEKGETEGNVTRLKRTGRVVGKIINLSTE